MMNILLIGSGAREHAIATRLVRSEKFGKLWTAPGNAGSARLGENVAIDPEDVDGLRNFAIKIKADLVVLGPDAAGAAGVADAMRNVGIRVFGPGKTAAKIESSKDFCRTLMKRDGIRVAEGALFNDLGAAETYLKSIGRPVVVKADGLAAGKGVYVCETEQEALNALRVLLVDRKLGTSGSSVLIEERLYGREVSTHAFTDGKTYAAMPISSDFKRLNDGDLGPNTGGLGVCSPSHWASERVCEVVAAELTKIIDSVNASVDYNGTIYPGFLIDDRGPCLLEINARFGDPEAQVLLPRLKTDLLQICLAVATQNLSDIDVEWDDGATVGVVMAARGYPEAPEKGAEISGIDDVDDDVEVFLANVKEQNGALIVDGGRVLTVVAKAETLEVARQRVYDNVKRISFDGAHYRTDIGLMPT